MNIDKALDLAMEHYLAGDLRQAESICKGILKKSPNNTHALHCLGVIYSRNSQQDLALKYIKRALQIDPYFADAYNNLGTIFQETKQPNEAIACYQKALSINPQSARTHYNLGVSLQDKGKLEEAINCYREALRLNFKTFGLFNNLGIVLQEKGQHEEAISCYQNAIKLNPDFADAYYNLGNTLKEKEHLDQALCLYKKALQLNANYADAYNNIGVIFKDKGQADAALIHFKKALESNPTLSHAYLNIGTIFQEKLNLKEAVYYYQKAIDINPNFADAHWNMGLALLSMGSFKQGWEQYEWRWKTKDFIHGQHDLSQPAWDGSSLKGKALFIYAEQGVGDEIMFASCLPEVIEKADSCTVECDKRLIPIFSRSFPKAFFIERNAADTHNPFKLSSVNVIVPMGSLPRYLRTEISSFPQRKNFLIPDAEKVDEWKGRFKKNLGDSLKIGISWRGGKKPDVKLKRSTTLEQWAKLFSLPGVNFINLQYGDCIAELDDLHEKLGITIYDWEDADPLNDLDGFAAQIAALDLVISVDNATVHMAGSLGVPVWTLLPFACDWRWMIDFEDTPWYPTMRLFRQTSPDKWESVFENVHETLKEAAENKGLYTEHWKSSLKCSFLNTPRRNEKNEPDLLMHQEQMETSDTKNDFMNEGVEKREKNKYTKAWNLDNRVYAHYSPGLELSNHIDFLDFFMKNDVKTILDAGIGSGKLCKKAINMGFECHGLDIAENCLDEDLVHLKDKILTVGTLWDSAIFQENQFDAIVCLDVLEHIPTNYIDIVIDNLFRWTKKYLFLQIALFQDYFGSRVGEPLHLTVEPKYWWDNKLSDFQSIQNFALKNKDGVDSYVIYLLEKVRDRKQ